MKFSKTKGAFLFLLHPIAHALLFALFTTIATLLEQPCDRDGIYVVFSSIAIFFLMTFPLVTWECSMASMVFQVLAMIKKEHVIKNVIMLIVALGYLAFDVLFSIRLWEGMASV